MDEENITAVKLTGTDDNYFENCAAFFDMAIKSGLIKPDSEITLYYSSDKKTAAVEIEKVIKKEFRNLQLTEGTDPSGFEIVTKGTDPSDFEIVTKGTDPSSFEIEGSVPLDFDLYFEFNSPSDKSKKILVATGIINELTSQAQRLSSWSTLFMNGKYKI